MGLSQSRFVYKRRYQPDICAGCLVGFLAEDRHDSLVVCLMPGHARDAVKPAYTQLVPQRTVHTAPSTGDYGNQRMTHGSRAKNELRGSSRQVSTARIAAGRHVVGGITSTQLKKRECAAFALPAHTYTAAWRERPAFSAQRATSPLLASDHTGSSLGRGEGSLCAFFAPE